MLHSDLGSEIYERPILIKQKKMNFPLQILKKAAKAAICTTCPLLASSCSKCIAGEEVTCRQCSSCHACR